MDTSLTYDADAIQRIYVEQLSPLIGASITFHLYSDGTTSNWDLGNAASISIADPMLRKGGVLPGDLQQTLRSLLPEMEGSSRKIGAKWIATTKSRVPPYLSTQTVEHTIESEDDGEYVIKTNGKVELTKANTSATVSDSLEGEVIFSEPLGRIRKSKQSNRVTFPAGFSAGPTLHTKNVVILQLGNDVLASGDEP
ncbi:hypothetical protein [Planctomycetes bacterium CA13]|uniref:hypothetical protein n=1 Tax=Novipirellula herctigrandis TaxID=2527986 RepID=UPI0011B57CA4